MYQYISMEKRGRSPSLRRRNSIEQQSIISPEIYAILEQRKLLTSSSAEHKKVPIYSKHTVSSILYAQNVSKRVPHSHSFDKTKSPRRSVDKPPIALSKVMPSKTKSNEDNLPSSYTKPSSPKPENTKKPHPRNYVNVVENNVRSQKQPTKGFESKTEELLSSKDDHNLTTYEECDKINPSESNDVILIVEDRDNQRLVEDHLDDYEMESHQKGEKILQCEILVPICSEENADHHMPQLSNTTCSDPINVTAVDSVINEHLTDHNDETFDAGGDHLITCPNDDKENQKAENEQVAPDQVDVGSKLVVEVDDQEQRKRKEPDDDEAPNKEDLILKMVAAYQQQVVAHGKKDIATHNNGVSVTEETISKLREQRRNKVKALVGAFESVISHDQYDVLPKRLLRTHQ